MNQRMLKTNHLSSAISYQIRSQAYNLGLVYPDIYLNLNYTKRLLFDRKSHQSKIVRKNTLLTIEGFPRSGNSFFTKLVLSCNPHLTNKVGHHLHHPANLIRSLKYNIPSVLMIRDPKNAIVSLKALIILGNLKNSKNRFVPSLNQLLTLYVRYYGCLESNINKLSIIALDDLIINQKRILLEIGRTCSLDFNKVSSVKFKQHALPSVERDQIKNFVADELKELDSCNLDKALYLFQKFSDNKV